jgi:hypothetical protein
MCMEQQVPRFIVRVGYEWMTPCHREVEVEADDSTDAGIKALARSDSDPDFWAEAIDSDGEASSTEVLAIDELERSE